jgi:outer membrane protein
MKYVLSIFVLFFLTLNVRGQSNEESSSFTLNQAIDYAIIHSLNVKNSDIDKRVAIARKGELKSHALPQINGNVDLIHNIKIQQVILENGAVPAFANPNIPKGQVTAFQLQLANQFVPSISGTQVIYDQSFFTNVHAAKVFQELSEKNVTRSKIEVAHNVTKAYYGVLVNEKQLASIEANLIRLDSVYKEANARFHNGLARKIEVDRIEVSFNNLKEEKSKVIRMADLSRALLKFQMDFPKETAIRLTDSLSENLLNDVQNIQGAKNAVYSNRIEYSIIETQLTLNRLERKSTSASYYPKLMGIATTGYNPAATKFSNLTQGTRWFNYSFVGLRLQVPIFNGFAMYHKVQEKKLEEERTNNNKKILERTIDLQVDESLINLSNSIESLKIQKRNLDLAIENVRVLKAENESGITMNLEVTTGEAALKDAQTNYYNALYNALLSKADYERAMGTLLK